MVTIINYKRRETELGKEFFVLEVQGGLEMVKSRENGNFYATAKKANIASTFDEQTCKALIGTQIEGKVEKENCVPYDYTIKETYQKGRFHDDLKRRYDELMNFLNM